MLMNSQREIVRQVMQGLQQQNYKGKRLGEDKERYFLYFSVLNIASVINVWFNEQKRSYLRKHVNWKPFTPPRF
jgi:hypothetical protein